MRRYSFRVSPLEQRQYERLLRFRTGLRRFLRWSAEQAAAAGLTSAQHQLLLAIRGHPDAAGPTVSDVARWLLLRHHSTVELVDRAQAAGPVQRHPDADDSRVVRLGLTRWAPSAWRPWRPCTLRNSPAWAHSSRTSGRDWTQPSTTRPDEQRRLWRRP